ncbi:MAG: MBL fold metallo-hydrolase, partial [Chitinophagaceae bacterium]
MQIIPLNEGIFSINKEKQIHLAQQDNNKNYLCPQGHILIAIRPFLIKTKHSCILLDTGIGTINSMTDKYTIIEELEKHNLTANHINIVLLSHLHKDHIGSIFLPNTNTLTYPNAIYYINEKEYLWASKQYTYFKEFSNYKNFLSSYQVCWLNQDRGILKNNIEYQVTGGHTRYHQVFWIREEQQTIFFGGDVAPKYKQLISKINARYDYAPEISKNYRELWAIEGKQQHWEFLFYHDIQYS